MFAENVLLWIFVLNYLCAADVLAHAFDVLKVELKSEVAKELFLYYQATPVITHYLKPTNKVGCIFCLISFCCWWRSDRMLEILRCNRWTSRSKNVLDRITTFCSFCLTRFCSVHILILYNNLLEQKWCMMCVKPCRSGSDKLYVC